MASESYNNSASNNSSLKERTVRGLFWGAMNSGLMQVLNAVFGMILARILDVEDYGLVGVIAIYSAIAQNLQESGFISALINRKDPTQRDFSSVFWFNITVGLCMYTLLWFLAPFIADYNHDDRLISLSRYAFISFVFGSFSIVPRAKLMKELKVKEQAIMSVAALLTSNIIGVIMAICGTKYWGIATQTIIYIGMVSILSWIFSRWRPSFTFSFKPIIEMFGFSCKLLVTYISSNLNRFAVEAIMGNFRSITKVMIGNYTNANKWNTMGNQTISGMIQSVAQPMFVQVGSDTGKLTQAFRKMLRFTSFVSFPLMFGFCMVAPEFIRCTVSEKWNDAVPLLQTLCIGGAFLPISTLYYSFIISRGKSGIYMWNVLSQSAIILLSLLLIQHYDPSLFGITGIHLITVIYSAINVLWVIVWHFFVWREIRLRYFHAIIDIMPFLLFSAATMAATYYLTLAIKSDIILLLARILLAAIIYVGILWLLRAKILRECIQYIKKKK